MLILKQNAANSVPTPPAGKGTIFLDDSDTLSVKTSDGNVENFPTVAASNSQVVFMNGASLSGESALTYDFNNNILSVTGNVAAGNVKTDNLLYANGNPWDLSDPGGSNTQIQFNDDESFGGSAAFTFDKSSNLVTVGANLNANNLNATTHITSGNVWANSGTVGASLLTGTLTTAAQPNITSVGTLSSLVVSGNANVANLNATGHLLPTVGNTYDLGSEALPWRDLWVSGESIRIGGARITANATSLVLQNPQGGQVVVAGNSVASSTSIVSGTSNVSIPTANGNVNTSVNGAANVLVITATGANIAGTLNATGNANVGNLGTAGLIVATGNIDGGNLNTTGVVSATGNVSGGNLTTAGVVAATGNVSGGNLTTAGALSVTGNANIGNLGTAQVLASANVTAPQLISNVSAGTAPLVVTSTTRVANLDVAKAGVANTVNDAAQPNITSVGTLTDLNVSGNAIVGGNLTVDGNLVYVNVETLAVEDPIIQLQTGPNGAAPVANSGKDVGTGLNYYDTQARVAFMGWDVSNAEFGMASQASITNEVVTFTSYGNLRANVFFGNAAGLTNIPGGNIVGNISGNISNAGHATTANTVVDNAQPNITSVGTLSSLAVTGNATAGNVYANAGTIGASLLTGTLTTASQPNITSVGTLGSLSVTGNANVGNIGAAAGVFTANVGAGNLSSAGVLSVIGNANVGNLGTAGLIVATGNIDGGNLNTTGVVSATGNVSGGNLTTAGVVAATGNVSGGNLTTAGALSVTGNANIGNLGTAQVLASANVTAPQLISNVSTGTAPLVVTSTTQVANLSVATAGVANTVNDAAQPNITSVGTLSSLTVSGNASAGNLNTAGKVVASTLESNVATGTAPFVVASTTRVANLDVAKSGIANTVNDAAQPNITSVGTLTGLSVNGNITAANITANTGVFTGNGSGLSALAGANVTGQVGNALVAGTVYTNAQPNITSVGTLSSLAVTGNVDAGNLTTTGILSVTGTGTSSIAGNLDMTSNNITNLAAPVNSTDAATKQYVDDIAQGLHVHAPSAAATPDTLANISGGTVTYNNGTAGVGATLTTTGTYTTIDTVNIASVGTRILVKNEANAAHNGIYTYTSSTVLTRATDFDTPTEMAGGDFTFVSGGATYNDTGWVMTDPVTTVGTDPVNWLQFSGAGTYQAGTGLTLTGSVFSVNASQTQVTSVGTLTELAVNGNITAANITANTGVFTGNGSGLTALAGANVTGQVGNALVAGTVYTNAQPNITSVGTLTSLGVSGTITAANITANTGVFTGNGSGLSQLAGGNVTGQVGNALVAGTVYTNAQPNITSVGSLTSLTVTGNASAGNLSTGGVLSVTGNANVGNLGTAGLITATGNVSGGNLTTAGVVAATGNVSGGNLTTAGALSVTGNANVGNLGTDRVIATGNISGTQLISNITTGTAPLVVTSTTVVANLRAATSNVANTVNDAAQPNITSVGTLTSLTVSGNISAGNITGGAFANGNSNVNIPAAAGNVNISVNGTANVAVVTATGVNVAGTLNATGNANVGNIGATGVVATTLAGNLTTAAQPNVTSLGTLTGLGVNGTITGVNITANTGVFTGNGSGLTALAGGNVTGQVANALVAGTVYTNAQPNITSVGTLSSLAVTGNTTSGNFIGVFANGNSNISIPAANGNINLSAAGGATELILTSTGANITGTLNATGNANVGNIGATNGVFTNVSGNGSGLSSITGGNVTGQVGNALVAGTVYTNAQPNITSVGTLTSVTVTGTATAGNLSTGGNLSVSGNAIITGNLTVDGNLVYVNVDTLAVEDPIINLQTGPNGAAPAANSGKDVGTALNYYDTQARIAFMGWDVSNAEFGMASLASISSEVVTFSTYGNLRVGNIIGNGQALSGITGANVTGTVSSATTAGTVTTAAQPNITSVGTLTGLGVNGTVTAVAFTANTGIFTGNGSALSALNASNISTGTLAQARLANASVTLGSTALTLGSTVTTVAGLSSVTSTTFVGALSGAATTAGTVTTAAQPNITSVGTLTSLGVNGTVTAVAFTANTGVFTGNGSGISAINGSNISTGTIAAARIATLNQNTTGSAATVTTNAQPNITSVGTLTGLTLANASTISVGSNTNVGTFTGNFSLSAGSRLNATYADLAEKYVADADYEPGTVLVFGGDHEVTLANEENSHRVAGVVSTNPAYTMNNECQGDHTVMLALQGRVPVKVHGPISKGDLMVSSANGHAVANNMARAGTIIGKALENFSGDHGVIEVVVGRV